MNSFKKSSFALAAFAMAAASSGVAQQSPFSSNSPYYQVVPGPENPPYPNYTNVDVGGWNTNAGWTTDISIETQNTNDPAGQQWQETDSYNPSTGEGGTAFLNTVVGYTPTNPAGNLTLQQGGWDLGNGIIPGSTNPIVYREFSPTQLGVPGRDDVWTFAQFSLLAPTTIGGPEDSFGFEIWNGAPGTGTSLGKFMFGRQYAFATGGTNTNNVGFAWYKDGILQTTNNNSALTAEWDVFYGVNYRFNLAVGSNNLINLSIDTLLPMTNGFGFVTNTTFIRDGALGGPLGMTALDYNAFSINWELASGDILNPGTGSIIVNNLEIITTSVPEPATWAVGLLLLTAAACKLRRRKTSPDVA
jgi:hypothetical protein